MMLDRSGLVPTVLHHPDCGSSRRLGLLEWRLGELVPMSVHAHMLDSSQRLTRQYLTPRQLNCVGLVQTEEWRFGE
jgi:hypothetical protein